MFTVYDIQAQNTQPINWLLPPISLNFRNARIDCLSTLSLMNMD